VRYSEYTWPSGTRTELHYHRLGLVKEPKRDGTGYRRYGSTDLLRLVQARTLAGAGVPLAEIGDLLDADAERLADSLADVERRLTDRIERRRTLRRLAAGNRVLLPDRACAILDRLADLDFDPDFVAVQEEALVLALALAPELFDSYLTQFEHRLNDPQHVDLLKRTWEAERWDPDDPRVEELAAAMADNLLANRELLVMPAGFQARPDSATRYGLINHHRADQWRTSARLTRLVEARLRGAGLDIPL
jgi:DNA-binding transcriptional MerR regulator